jgi:transposase
MATQHRIRSAFFHEGKSISVIAREFDIDRKTVRKYIERDDWNETADTVPQGRPSVMDPFLPMIELWLTEDRDRRRKQRHTARRVFDRLVTEHEFTGSYRTVAMHVRDIRSRVFQESRPALPLQHIPGEAQADFGEADWLQNGARVHGSYLVLSFPASNAGFLQLTPGQNQECLFEALLTLFDAVGGVPRRQVHSIESSPSTHDGSDHEQGWGLQRQQIAQHLLRDVETAASGGARYTQTGVLRRTYHDG